MQVQLCLFKQIFLSYVIRLVAFVSAIDLTLKYIGMVQLTLPTHPLPYKLSSSYPTYI